MVDKHALTAVFGIRSSQLKYSREACADCQDSHKIAWNQESFGHLYLRSDFHVGSYFSAAWLACCGHDARSTAITANEIIDVDFLCIFSCFFQQLHNTAPSQGAGVISASC